MITCSAADYDHATWPSFAPYGVSQYVNGVCDPGYQPTNPALPPQRYCAATGTYTVSELNPCIRTPPPWWWWRRGRPNALTRSPMPGDPADDVPQRSTAPPSALTTPRGLSPPQAPPPRARAMPASRARRFARAKSTAPGRPPSPTRAPVRRSPTPAGAARGPNAAPSADRPPSSSAIDAYACARVCVDPVLSCPVNTVGGTTFAVTVAGAVGTGTCTAGYTQDPSGAPTCTCSLAGTWQTAIALPCLRTCTPGVRPPTSHAAPHREWAHDTAYLTNPDTHSDQLHRQHPRQRRLPKDRRRQPAHRRRGRVRVRLLRHRRRAVRRLQHHRSLAGRPESVPAYSLRPMRRTPPSPLLITTPTRASPRGWVRRGEHAPSHQPSHARRSRPLPAPPQTGTPPGTLPTLAPPTRPGRAWSATRARQRARARAPSPRPARGAPSSTRAHVRAHTRARQPLAGQATLTRWRRDPVVAARSEGGGEPALLCPSINDVADPLINATFPATSAGSIAVGTCAAGSYGLPQRQCLTNGTWASGLLANPCSSGRSAEPARSAPCSRRPTVVPAPPPRGAARPRPASPCPALADDNDANWEAGVPGVYASGTCISGWYGAPTRLCNLDGWGSVSSPCQRTSSGLVLCATRSRKLTQPRPHRPGHTGGPPDYTCPAVTANNAVYAAAPSLSTNQLGVCGTGYSGAPLRNCSATGAWVDVPSPQCSRTCVPRLILSDTKSAS